MKPIDQQKKSSGTTNPSVREELRIRIRGENTVSHSPEVKNGERILWVNETHEICKVLFDEERSPFENKLSEYTVHPGASALSNEIQGAVGETYIYAIKFEGAGRRKGKPHKGDPTIIVK